MSVFGKYSRYYDLLYRDKDYAAEAEFVRGMLQKHRPDAHSLLDLGCGTGRHAALLARAGYTVTGVDRSQEMLEVARSQDALPGLDFVRGDLRGIRLGRKFDVVLSLFHVMSYQTSNADLDATFATASAAPAPPATAPAAPPALVPPAATRPGAASEFCCSTAVAYPGPG